MNAIEMLEQEHKGAKKAMGEISRAKGDKRKAMFTGLKYELELHDKIEETVFYPAVLSHPKAADFQAMDKVAHEMVEAALDKLAKLDAEDAKWMTEFSSMQVKLLKHISDEETSYFVKIRQALSAAELTALGDKMKAKKEELMKVAVSAK